jgi:hypothetical protein
MKLIRREFLNVVVAAAADPRSRAENAVDRTFVFGCGTPGSAPAQNFISGQIDESTGP